MCKATKGTNKAALVVRLLCIDLTLTSHQSEKGRTCCAHDDCSLGRGNTSHHNALCCVFVQETATQACRYAHRHCTRLKFLSKTYYYYACCISSSSSVLLSLCYHITVVTSVVVIGVVICIIVFVHTLWWPWTLLVVGHLHCLKACKMITQLLLIALWLAACFKSKYHLFMLCCCSSNIALFDCSKCASTAL